MNPDSNCALCEKKLTTIYRIYFGDAMRHHSLISLCMDCYHDVEGKIERSRTDLIKSIFKDAGRLSNIRSGIYSDKA